MTRLDDKVDELSRLLDELNSILPGSFSEYDIKTKAACERYFERIIEVIVDAAFLKIKAMKLATPGDDKAAFDSLAEAGIISEVLAKSLREAKGMRNIIAHEYGEVDDKLVFEAVTNELPRDAAEFLEKL